MKSILFACCIVVSISWFTFVAFASKTSGETASIAEMSECFGGTATCYKQKSTGPQDFCSEPCGWGSYLPLVPQSDSGHKAANAVCDDKTNCTSNGFTLSNKKCSGSGS